MGIEKVNVQITADESEALASARRVEREMEKVEQKAKDAQRAVSGARAGDSGLRSRFGGLLGRLGLKAGDDALLVGNTFKLGRQGFQLQEGFRKAAVGGGAVLGVVAAAHGIGNAMEKSADFRDWVREGGLSEMMRDPNIAKQFALDLSRGLHEKLGSAALLRGILRLSGERSDVVDTAFELAFSARGEATVDAEIAQQAAGRRAFFEMLRKQEEAEARRTASRDASLAKIDETIERQLAGLKTDIFRPKGIRLNREQNRSAQRLWDESRERNINRQGALQKEEIMRVHLGEGR